MMKLKIKLLKWTVILMAAGVFISGCASKQKKIKTEDREKYLISSGFKKMLADTGEKLDHLKKMPQREIFNKEWTAHSILCGPIINLVIVYIMAMKMPTRPISKFY